MKLRNLILILFLVAIGCQTMPAEEKENITKYPPVIVKY